METKQTIICECNCHQDGVNLLHVAPCCRLTYEKCIDKDGKIDIMRWADAFKRVTKDAGS